MAKNDPEFRLRLPEKLKSEIEDQAKKNQRSINAEILSRLQQSFSWGDYDIAALAADIERLERQVGELQDAVFPGKFMDTD